MDEYQIRILNEDRTTSMVAMSSHLNANMAIAAGMKLAKGLPFEVWRADECVFVTQEDRPLRFPSRAPSKGRGL